MSDLHILTQHPDCHVPYPIPHPPSPSVMNKHCKGRRGMAETRMGQKDGMVGCPRKVQHGWTGDGQPLGHQGTRHKAPRHKAQGTRHKAQGTRHKIGLGYSTHPLGAPTPVHRGLLPPGRQLVVFGPEKGCWRGSKGLCGGGGVGAGGNPAKKTSDPHAHGCIYAVG